MPTQSLNTTFNKQHFGAYTDTRNPGTTFRSSFASSVVASGSRNLASNPRWRDTVQKGQDATLPYTRYHWEGHEATMSYTTRYVNNADPRIRQDGSAVLVSPSAVSLPSLIAGKTDQGLYDLALTRLKRKLNGHMNRGNQLVPLAELREMRGLVRSLAEQSIRHLIVWAQFLGEVKKVSPRHMDIAAKRLRSAGQELWLTWSFGISPTVSSIQQAAKQIVAYLEREDKTLTERSGARRVWSQGYGNSAIWNQVVPNVVPMSSYSVSCSLDYMIGGGFNLALKSSNDYSAVDMFQFGLRDLPAVGWELMPYSWAIDYFTNIGQYLDDTFILPSGSTKYLFMNRLFKAVITETLSLKANDTSGKYDLKPISSPGVFTYTEFERAKLGSLPRIGLRIKTADEVASHAVTKVLNLAALLGSKHKPRLMHSGWD